MLRELNVDEYFSKKDPITRRSPTIKKGEKEEELAK